IHFVRSGYFTITALESLYKIEFIEGVDVIMFGLADLIGLVISSFIILPVVTFLREAGYFVISGLFGVKNPRLTIGSGPRLFKLGVLDIRKYYHVNSWFSFDSVKRKSNFAYICIYAGPILINVIVAVTMNALIA